jgi:hypothetical protein
VTVDALALDGQREGDRAFCGLGVAAREMEVDRFNMD